MFHDFSFLLRLTYVAILFGNKSPKIKKEEKKKTKYRESTCALLFIVVERNVKVERENP